MAKFAALSNQPTSNCQRRKGKRFKIPKVTSRMLLLLLLATFLKMPSPFHNFTTTTN